MTTLGPYEIGERLGRGAMAVVWRAWDPKLEREVAIKEPILPDSPGEVLAAEFSERFVREGRAAAKLNHPGIVTIYAADIYDGRPAIVMELIEGETLASILDRGPLPPTASLAILDQLLDAVAYAHSKGVVHRDIKPDNVFVTEDGRVKLADFGIAHVGTGATLTQAGTVMGTPGYMAPEQVTGAPVDARADIFAIGAVAYEMFTGANPFGATAGDAPTTVMYRIVHEQPPEVQFVGETSAAGAAIATALAKDPADRFADAGAFRAALAGGPILTGRAAGIAGASVTASVQSTAPTFVVGEARKDSKAWVVYAAVAGLLAVGVIGLFVSSGSKGGGGVAAPQPASAGQTVIGEAPAEPTAESAPAASPEPDPNVVSEQEVRDAVEGWRSAWESEDLGAYMGYYAPDFYSNYKSMNRGQWQSYKRDLFTKYAWQTVAISGVKIDASGDAALVKFNQTWKSDSGGDYGRKTLKMGRVGGTWLITGEEWTKK